MTETLLVSVIRFLMDGLHIGRQACSLSPSSGRAAIQEKKKPQCASAGLGREANLSTPVENFRRTGSNHNESYWVCFMILCVYFRVWGFT